MFQPNVAAPVWEWEGMSPTGNGTKLFRLEKSALMEEALITGNSAIFYDAFLIPSVTMHPAAVHRNLKRAGQEFALCYQGIPSYELARQQGHNVELPPGFTFTVFVTADFVVAKWRPCEQDPTRGGFAIDHENRFGERLWPPQG